MENASALVRQEGPQLISGALEGPNILGRRSMEIPQLVKAAVLVISLGPGACGDGGTVSTTVSDSAGLAIVTNYGTPSTLPWVADTIRVFGGEETGDATFFRSGAALVDVDPEGRIFVLEPLEHRVVVFDSTGRVIGQMGSEGEGPGEVKFPLSVTATNKGKAFVHDGAGRLVRLEIGERRGVDTPFQYAVINMSLRHVMATPTGLLAWARQSWPPPAGTEMRMDRLLSIVDSDTTVLISGQSSHSTTAHYPDCGITFTIPQPLAPRILWSRWADRVAVSIWGGFRIDLFERHLPTTSIRLAEVSNESLTRAQALAVLDSKDYRGPCSANAEEVVTKHGYYPRPQRVQGLAVAPSGQVWVRVSDEDRNRILVFDSGGQILGALPDGFPMPFAFLPDNRLLIQVVDDLDVERVGIVAVLP